MRDILRYFETSSTSVDTSPPDEPSLDEDRNGQRATGPRRSEPLVRAARLLQTRAAHAGGWEGATVPQRVELKATSPVLFDK
jgi:hypothetical protein